MQNILLLRVLCGYCLIFMLFANSVAAKASDIKMQTQGNFLLISDIHTDSSDTAVPMEINPDRPYYGLKNNLDTKTFSSLLGLITDGIGHGQIATPDFIIFLGDTSSVLALTHETILSNEQSAFKLLRTKWPNTPIFFVFGNHDSLEQSWGPFNVPTLDPPSPYAVAISQNWADGFLSTGVMCNANKSITTPCLIDQNATDGYYSAYLMTHLRLIALNTTMLDESAVGTTAAAAEEQIAWFEAEMSDAAHRGDSVILAMHVPLGGNIEGGLENKFGEMPPTYENAVLQIISNYNRNIIGMLGGHTHYDSLRIFTRGILQERVNFLISAAALATYNGNAPSIKTIYYRSNGHAGNNWFLSDYDTFYFLAGQTPQLKKLYSYSDYYCDGNKRGIMGCIYGVSVDKMNLYHTAGNPNYYLSIANPENVFIKLPPPNNNSPTPTQSAGGGSNNAFGIAAAAIAGTAAVIGGASMVEENSH